MAGRLRAIVTAPSASTTAPTARKTVWVILMPNLAVGSAPNRFITHCTPLPTMLAGAGEPTLPGTLTALYHPKSSPVAMLIPAKTAMDTAKLVSTRVTVMAVSPP